MVVGEAREMMPGGGWTLRDLRGHGWDFGFYAEAVGEPLEGTEQ